MIGNDLVDLQLAVKESNWQRKGYLDKVCTAEEQQLILTSTNPLVTFWTLWSMKESVYKITNRITGIRNYSPTSYNCTILQEDKLGIKPDELRTGTQQNRPAGATDQLTIREIKLTGKLHFEQQVFFSHTQIKGQRLHTIAVLQPTDFELIHTVFYQNHLATKPIPADYLHQFNQTTAPYVLSKNRSGIPEITHTTRGTKHPVSVSHHGRYLAIIYSGSLLLTD